MKIKKNSHGDFFISCCMFIINFISIIITHQPINTLKTLQEAHHDEFSHYSEKFLHFITLNLIKECELRWGWEKFNVIFLRCKWMDGVFMKIINSSNIMISKLNFRLFIAFAPDFYRRFAKSSIWIESIYMKIWLIKIASEKSMKK